MLLIRSNAIGSEDRADNLASPEMWPPRAVQYLAGSPLAVTQPSSSRGQGAVPVRAQAGPSSGWLITCITESSGDLVRFVPIPLKEKPCLGLSSQTWRSTLRFLCYKKP